MGNCISCSKSNSKTELRPGNPVTVKKGSSQSQNLSSPQTEEGKGPNRGMRPARKQEKRKAPVGDVRKEISDDMDAPTAQVSTRKKSSREVQDLRMALNSHFLFSSLSSENVELVIEEMKHYSLGPREVIFQQGETGHNFFIVASGRVEIVVNGVTKGFLTKGQGFGELALMHDSHRTATISTIDRVTLWGIDRKAFRSAVKSMSDQKYLENKQFVETVPMFSILTQTQKELLLSVAVSQEYSDGQKIVIEGDPGDVFYAIKEGRVSCTSKKIEIRQMTKGDFFGEQALIYGTQRTATVTAIGRVVVLSVGREDLVRVYGEQMQRIVYKNSQRIAIERSKFLNGLNKFQTDSVIEKMQIVKFGEGEPVIEADTEKNKLWIIVQGALKSDAGNSLGVFECIGDSDLNEGQPGNFEENFFAQEESVVAVIDRTNFEEIIGGTLSFVCSQNVVFDVLKRVHLFRALPYHKIQALASALQIKSFRNQELIFSENDPGDCFYLVKEGSVNIMKDGVKIRTITKHDYFGERSIIFQENRTATVVSNGDSSCWVLNKQDFWNLLDEGIRNQLMKRIELQDESVILDDLKPVKLLGKGMFGNVFLTVNSNTKKPYAVKSVQRRKIEGFDIYDNLVLERQILLQLDHPFIMKLVKTFKDPERIYFLTEYVRGEDLFDVLRVLNLLTDEQSKFYVGGIVLMLEHLHERKIIYRDLKPENIMIDDEGYPKLIDFGTAKILEGRTYTVVGTPHYMAPEVIVGKGYGVAADYWSLGIMLYEFLCGCVPFGEDEEDPYRIYQKVLERRLIYPTYVNKLIAKPFIEQLLSKNPAMRGNYESIKHHQWFKGFNWDYLLGKQFRPPHVPSLPKLNNVIKSAFKSKKELRQEIKKEEMKDVAEIPPHKPKPPKPNWDADF